MELSKEILDYLKRLTESREYTKRDIGEFCGTSATQISYVLNGHRKPNRKLYNKLLKFAEHVQEEKAIREEREANIAKQLQSA